MDAVPVVCWNPARNRKHAPPGIAPPGTTVEAIVVSPPLTSVVAVACFCQVSSLAKEAAGVPSTVHVFAAVQPSQF